MLNWQTPDAWQWANFLVSGVMGTAAHYCLTRAFHVADISATQSVKFLNLVWNATAGFLVFSDVPTHTTLLGGFVIFLATTWIARREARDRG
jgi:drug/metabolite transporter (DMT)-like permease